MAKRGGSYLEESVAVLFKKAGFNTKLNTWINGYEVDVLAYKGDYKLAIECKHYEHSHIVIRNILHQWASKLDFIKVDKVVVVIAGQELSREDYRLSKGLGIVLINDEKIHKLNSLIDNSKLIAELNDLICFDKELYSKKQTRRVFKISIGIVLILVGLYLFYRTISDKFIFLIILGMFLFILIGASIKPRRRRRRNWQKRNSSLFSPFIIFSMFGL